MIIKRYFLILGLIFASILGLSAQVLSPVNEFMHRSPLYGGENPARFSHVNGYVGIPGISNLQITFVNSLFNLNNLIRYDAEGYPVALTPNNFVNHLSEKNNGLNLSLNEEILNFGFRVKRSFISIGLNLHSDTYLRLSKDVLAFPINGNMSYTEKPAQMEMDINSVNYADLHVRLQLELSKRLYIGVRPRLLLGLAQLKTNTLQATVATDPNTYALTINYEADVLLHSAMPLTATDNRLGLGTINMDMLKASLKNMGFAIDLGAVYRISDKLGVEISAMDLGFIRWNNDAIQFKSNIGDGGSLYKDGSLFFDGIPQDVLQDLLKGNTSKLSAYGDSLSNYFPSTFEQVPGKSSTALNARFNAGVYFDILPKHRFSLQLQGRCVGKTFYPSMTVAYSGRIGNILDITVPYSIMSGSYDNLGVGIGLNLWGFYLYAASNNVLFFRKNFGSQLNAQVGLVVNWGYKKAQERSLKEE
ncbi:MAG: DUF5723 family protein [Bacteroidales bacterium]|jgi:hypothetical protein|nr:DUF5723 family protein [Bacteroidales bacterium]